MMNIDTEGLVRLNPADTTQSHAAIIGMTGSGKTNTLYVIAEELSAGDVKVTIVDPEGDYGDLRYGTKALILGKGRKGNHIDIQLTPDNAAAAADVMCRYDTPIIILDLSGFDIDTRDEFLLAYVGKLWKNYQDEDFPPHRLIVDEVQLFAPQTEKRESKHLLQDIAARARKRNFTLAVATQQPQSVDKKILNATRYRIFHQVARGTAMKALKDLLPASVANAAPKADVEEMIADMAVGDVLFMIGNGAKKAHIRASNTFHPDNGVAVVGRQLPFDDGTLDRLRGLISSNQAAEVIKAEVKHEIAEDTLIEELKARVAELETENANLRQQLAATPSPKTEGDETALPVVAIEHRDLERERLVRERDCERQKRIYQLILMNVKRQSKLDRRIVSFLADHEPKEYNAMDLGIALALSPDTLPSNPPMALLKANLISRRKVGGKFVYRSMVLSRVEAECPMIDRSQAIENIAGMME